MGARSVIDAVDLFCGAGGEATGIRLAVEEDLGRILNMVVVNHWDLAIQTHKQNHPGMTHLCESIQNLQPLDIVPRGRLDLLWASPECTHHSNARGGRPRSDQSRASPWLILKWLSELYVSHVIIENVREMRDWGPLGADGKPIKSRKGETFEAFIVALRSLGYKVEHEILRACDYGDPTSRERLFIQAVRGGKRINWPEPTHGTVRQPWHTAREIIDWTIPGNSIFTRKRPLAPATIARICAGIKRFWGPFAEPFLVTLRGGGSRETAQSIDQPCPTVTACGTHLGLVQPFILSQWSGGAPRSVDKPLPTVASKCGHGLVQPFIIPTIHGERDRRSHSLQDPFPTVTGVDAWGLIEPFVFTMEHSRADHKTMCWPAGRPLPTVTTCDSWGIVEPLIASYYGKGLNICPISRPLPTVTTRDKFMLVAGNLVRLDIRFRMLLPHELAAAQGFPSDYTFKGCRRDQVKQIGNAVPCGLARALTNAALAA